MYALLRAKMFLQVQGGCKNGRVARSVGGDPCVESSRIKDTVLYIILLVIKCANSYLIPCRFNTMPKTPDRRLTYKERVQIWTLREEGLAQKDIAQKLGIPQ